MVFASLLEYAAVGYVAKHITRQRRVKQQAKKVREEAEMKPPSCNSTPSRGPFASAEYGLQVISEVRYKIWETKYRKMAVNRVYSFKNFQTF